MANALDALTWDQRAGGGCCGGAPFMAAKYDHFVAVMRHSERIDGPGVADRLRDEGPPPGKENEWPWAKDVPENFELWNPPLTDRGIPLAEEHARNLLECFRETAQKVRGRELDFGKVAVVTSPLRRCVATALEVCKVFGCGLLVDIELCEIYDEKAMHSKTQITLPDYEAVQKEFPDAPICNEGPLGSKPQWQENWKEYRARYARMLERWLNRGAQTQMDYILVSHGDFLPCALNLVKPETWFNAELKIDYCAFMVISRTAELSLSPQELESIKGKAEIDVIPQVRGNTWMSANMEVHVPETSPFKYSIKSSGTRKSAHGTQEEFGLMAYDAANPELARKNASNTESGKENSQRKEAAAEKEVLRKSMSRLSLHQSKSAMSLGSKPAASLSKEDEEQETQV